METDKLFLIVSLTINLCLGLYVFPPLVLVWFAQKHERNGNLAASLIRWYKKTPNGLRKLCKDLVFSTALFVSGIYLLKKTEVYQNPFRAFVDNRLRGAMAVDIGHHLFRLLTRLVPMKKLRHSFSSSCHSLLTVFSLLIILITKENNIFGSLVLVFEGSITWSDISRAEELWNDGTRAKRSFRAITLLGNLFATFSLRMVLPTVLLALSVHNSSVLEMSYISICLVVLDVIFYYSLSVVGLYSLVRNARAVRATQQEQKEEDYTGFRERRATLNNNMCPRLTTSLLEMHDIDNPNRVTQPVSGASQTSHAYRSLTSVIRNF